MSLPQRLHFLRHCLITSIAFSAASAIAQTPPPLLPGEIYFNIKNNCGVIYNREDFKPPNDDVEKIKKEFAEQVWTGACINGLANGVGVLALAADLEKVRDYKTEFSYGRDLGKMVEPTLVNGVTNTFYFNRGNRGHFVTIANIADPYAPVWGYAFESYSTKLSDPEGFHVQTSDGNFCSKSDPDCTPKYGVQTWRDIERGKSGIGTAVTTPCPNPRSTAGCEKLWHEKADAIIARVKAFVVEEEKKIADDKRRYAELTQPAIDRQTARKIADAAEAKRAAAATAIAREKDQVIAAQEQQERDARDAIEEQKRIVAETKTKAAAEKAFQASLAKLNAGELFALADKRRNEGDTAQAREILRTLITKFPNNALAGVAAQQMTQLPAPKPVEKVATENVVPAKPPASSIKSPNPNRDAGLEDMADVFGANKRK